MKCWLGSGGRRVGRSSWPRTCVGGTRTSTDASPSVRARLADSKAPGSSGGPRAGDEDAVACAERLRLGPKLWIVDANDLRRAAAACQNQQGQGHKDKCETTEIDRNAHDHDLGSHDLFHGDGFTSEAPQSDELRRLSRALARRKADARIASA